MKKAILVLTMVLLSTAAWGETEQKCKEICHALYIESGTTGQYLFCVEVCKNTRIPKSGVSFTAPDPTVWQTIQRDITGPPVPMLDCRLRCADSKGVVNPECESACLGQKPWADSRYRLEKNEVTGRLRIIHFNVYANEWQEEDLDIDKKGNVIRNEEQMIEILDRYRKEEAIHRSWRPIK